MSQPRRTIENLLKQGLLPLQHADNAALELQVFPTKKTWLAFFDKATLIIGAVALLLALVFFVAYNWLHMGRMGKFALVEGALVISIGLYVLLSFRRRFQLVRQLLLLIASVITGSFLALLGQVYQTGADSWQLFFGWGILIIPWVFIARLPALWLLWLALIHAVVILYSDISPFLFDAYIFQDIFRIAVLAAINFIAFNLWLFYFERQRFANNSPHKTVIYQTTASKKDTSKIAAQIKPSLHWSTYVVGLLSTYFISRLALMYITNDASSTISIIALVIWAGWCGFIYWRFYKQRINLLMLTYLCGSIITIVMFWAGEFLLNNWEALELLLLALLLIAISSAAMIWLRRVARLEDSIIYADAETNAKTKPIEQVRGDYE